jgi:hypothetical protein
MSASPKSPPWADGLLSLVLRPDDAETVCGDLIEEYRETVYPACGSWRANAWLLRQVGGFVWRAVWGWGLLLALLMSGRAVFDTFAPPANVVSGWGPRAAFTTWSVTALFVLVGAWGARRTGRALGGTLAAIATHLIGFILGVPFQIALFVSVIRHDPRMLDLFEVTGGWGEEWGLPLMLVPIVLTLGTLGGILGKHLGGASRAQTLT